MGTPCYIAPEIESLKERRQEDQSASYGTEVDAWSVGCVLLVMLVARFPEFVRSEPNLPMVKLDGIGFEEVSDEAKGLIGGLMEPRPAVRTSMVQALQHPWLADSRASPDPSTCPKAIAMRAAEAAAAAQVPSGSSGGGGGRGSDSGDVEWEQSRTLLGALRGGTDRRMKQSTISPHDSNVSSMTGDSIDMDRDRRDR